MKYKTLCTYVLLIVIILIVFNGCTNNVSNISSDPTESERYSLENSEWHLLTDWAGAIYGAAGDKGYYYITTNFDGSFLINYLDYTSQNHTVLCSKPDCQHNDDTCNAWISPNQGGVVPLVVDESVLIFSRGNDISAEYEASPQVIRMDLSGNNREVLLKLSSSEEFIPPFISDGRTIICIYRKYDASGNAPIVENSIIAIDSHTGTLQKMHELDSSFYSIIGSFLDGIFLVKRSENNRTLLGYYPDTNTFKELSSWNTEDKSVFVTETGYGFVNRNGNIEVYNSPEFQKYDLPNLTIRLDENLGINSFRFMNFFDDKAIFELIYLSDNGPITKILGFSMKDNQLKEITLYTDYLGVQDPIDIVGILSTKLVVISNLKHQEVTLLDNYGIPIQSKSLVYQYALIDKNDYWNSIPNYAEFESIWF